MKPQLNYVLYVVSGILSHYIYSAEKKVSEWCDSVIKKCFYNEPGTKSLQYFAILSSLLEKKKSPICSIQVYFCTFFFFNALNPQDATQALALESSNSCRRIMLKLYITTI